jgi:hypothetical protein
MLTLTDMLFSLGLVFWAISVVLMKTEQITYGILANYRPWYFGIIVGAWLMGFAMYSVAPA